LTAIYAVIVVPELTLELIIRDIWQVFSFNVEVLLFNNVRVQTPVASEQETPCADGAPGNPTIVCVRTVVVLTLVGVANEV
jgi:hypothetical protein